MSSATSTEKASSKDQSLQPWQFFVLAALGCAAAATFIARGQGIAAVILVSLLMAGAALVGMAALGAIKPLVTREDDRTVMIGRRTRAALEREKLLSLRAIKELEFDRAMGKVSEEDWKEMSGRLRVRATGLMRQLDAGAGYREQIERDVANKIAGDPRLSRPAAAGRGSNCRACSTPNDDDARFCKNCGAKL